MSLSWLAPTTIIGGVGLVIAFFALLLPHKARKGETFEKRWDDALSKLSGIALPQTKQTLDQDLAQLTLWTNLHLATGPDSFPPKSFQELQSVLLEANEKLQTPAELIDLFRTLSMVFKTCPKKHRQYAVSKLKHAVNDAQVVHGLWRAIESADKDVIVFFVTTSLVDRVFPDDRPDVEIIRWLLEETRGL